MALDEAALLGEALDAAIFRVYRWIGPACTFGYGQPWRAARAACDSRGWTQVSPVRRATGGGIVFHDGDLTFSLVFSWERLQTPEAIYARVHRAAASGLARAGARASLHAPNSRPLGAAAACFSRAEPMDLVAEDGRKVLGGALRKRGARGLYQGSLRLEPLGIEPEAAAESLRESVRAEFGGAGPEAFDESRLAAGRRLEPRYRSREWNERR